MPRQISRVEQDYAPGTYGPFSLDSFTNQNTDYLEVTVTIPAASPWPHDVPLFIVTLAFDDGSKAIVPVDGDQGALTSGTIRFSIPKLNDTKKTVSGATATLEVFNTFRTAITVKAI